MVIHITDRFFTIFYLRGGWKMSVKNTSKIFLRLFFFLSYYISPLGRIV